MYAHQMKGFTKKIYCSKFIMFNNPIVVLLILKCNKTQAVILLLLVR